MTFLCKFCDRPIPEDQTPSIGLDGRASYVCRRCEVAGMVVRNQKLFPLKEAQ